MELSVKEGSHTPLKTIQFERGNVRNMRIHVLPTDQFKTYAISVYTGLLLAEDTVTPTALVPFVLRRGTKSYPETKQFRERLDELYGAGLGFDIYKRGDYQIVQFRMDIIEDRFVSSSEPLLRQGLQFLGETLTEPAQENGSFRNKYVESEKTSLQKRLEAIINDKIRYAAERCLEEMCSNEPYRLHPLGKLDALAAISPESLFEQYQTWLRNAPIDIYVVGNTTLQEVKELVEQYFPIDRPQSSAYSKKTANPQVGEVKEIVERLDVKQGKLNMGLRTYITYADEQYPTALMYNGIFGGYPHAKLFTNVREKASLAYYASSRLDGHKGILTVQSGIEIENYEKAVKIIREQLESMRSGQITETELHQTRAMISNQLQESQDSAFEMIGFDFNNVLSGAQRTVPSLIEAVNAATVADIQRVAEQVKLDTIYFLRDQKGGIS
ncbi:EF-P 5-aminopentanol modification-associated protein YfmF [Paenibacillus thalictri]|uniref:Insulinase family protein n=1 Tax=Paenibacillus thalictri TaxID=2527873 RepID=A0A4Q9DP06_9BACL|nr:pitrilysin family protein [Paenibacillus thalictri]TBL77791.1 insulinase family protein [Paenibacillus thalictri]